MSNDAEFKVGDVVRLKSGGPKMTVNHVTRWKESDEHLSARCDWFEGNKKEVAVFILPVLEIADDR